MEGSGSATIKKRICIHITIDKIYAGFVKRIFYLFIFCGQICNRVSPLIDVRIWFLLHI